MTIAQYDSREALTAQQRASVSWRKLGVLVSAPYFHHGLKETHVEVSRETVTLTSTTYGRSWPAGEVMRRVRAATEVTVAEVDMAIAELAAHRDRLCAELKTFDQREWATTVDEPS